MDERADDARAVALRAHLALEGEADGLPDAGWHLVGFDVSRAEYVTKANGSYVSVRVDQAGGAWDVVGWGGCEPEMVMPPNVRAATWELAPDASEPDADSTAIGVLVSERSCASGQSPEGRIVGPWIEFDQRVVRIAFGVTVLPGGQECPGSPPARVDVQLAQPVGDRVLSDVGVWPPTNQWAE